MPKSALAYSAMHASLSPARTPAPSPSTARSEEHTSELQSHVNLVCRLLLEKKKARTCDVVAVATACGVWTCPGARLVSQRVAEVNAGSARGFEFHPGGFAFTGAHAPHQAAR